MNIIRTNTPGKDQINSLLHLQEICRRHDHISFSFPMEDDCTFYLLYDEERLLSALTALFNENEEYECYACTLPANRRQGCFTLLLEELLKESGDRDLIFPVDETSKDTVMALVTIGAALWYQEHLMELTASGFYGTSQAKNNLFQESLSLSITHDQKKSLSLCNFLLNGSSVGCCYLDFRKQSVYFYGFEIAEHLRNQGLGSACLFLLLKTCFSLPEAERPGKLFLQVSGQNLPAMALYKKAGFQITESLSYYIY